VTDPAAVPTVHVKVALWVVSVRVKVVPEEAVAV